MAKAIITIESTPMEGFEDAESVTFRVVYDPPFPEDGKEKDVRVAHILGYKAIEFLEEQMGTEDTIPDPEAGTVH